MSETKTPVQDQLVQCDVCLKEIPASDSKNVEASDYVSHFCGLECYDKWRKQPEAEESSK